jgi:hypothetical protein
MQMAKIKLDRATSAITTVESANNWLDIALNHKQQMIKTISTSYPLSTSVLERYADQWHRGEQGADVLTHRDYVISLFVHHLVK